MIPFLFVLLFLSSASCSWAASDKMRAVTVSDITRDMCTSIKKADADVTQKNAVIGLAIGVPETHKKSLFQELLTKGKDGEKVLELLGNIPRYFNHESLQYEDNSGMHHYVNLVIQANQPTLGRKKTDNNVAIDFLKKYVRCFGPDKVYWERAFRPMSQRAADFTRTLDEAKKVLEARDLFENDTMLQMLLGVGCAPAVVEALFELGGDRVKKEVVDSLSCTPLHFGVLKGNYPVVKMLLENGAKVQGSPAARNSPLCSAVVRKPMKEGEAANLQLDMVRLLLDYNADMNDPRENIFMAAADHAPMHILATLLKHRGNADVSIDGKNILLYMAERRREWTGFKDHVKPLLLNMPVLLAETTDLQFNVLHAAALRDGKFWDSLSDEELQQPIATPDRFGQTPVHLLTMVGNTGVLLKLRNRGVLSNSVLLQEDQLGKRPIDRALDRAGGNFDHPLVKAVMPDLSNAALPGMSKNKIRALRNQYIPKKDVHVELSADSSKEELTTIPAHQKPRDRMQKLTTAQLAQLGIGEACVAYESGNIVAIKDDLRMTVFSVENGAQEDRILPLIAPYKDPNEDADGAHKISPLLQKYLHRFGKDVTTDATFIEKYGLNIDPDRHVVIALETATLPLFIDPKHCGNITPNDCQRSAMVAMYRMLKNGELEGIHLMFHKPKYVHQQVATA